MEVPRSVPHVNVVAAAIVAIAAGSATALWIETANALAVAATAGLGIVAAQSPKIAQQWERGVVLRFGRFLGLRGPGLFWIVPFADRVSSWIDQRTITTSFAAEQTLTADTVPVAVDAILFWMVNDAEKAAMATAYPDRTNMRLWALLAIVGAILCVIGWYRYFGS